jgi:superfamily I DNA and/or RNA helicase/transcription elongation GreA/GreB family factor
MADKKKKFLKHLNRKLKTGNLRSIHLNALPGRYVTRLDLSTFNFVKENLANRFIENLLSNSSFSFKLSYDTINLNLLEEEHIHELNFIAKKLNGMYYQNFDNYLEHGIMTFGFGFPLIIKRSKNDPMRIIKAPLIIWNLDIEKSKHKTNEWVIRKDEDNRIALNEVLISYLEQDERVALERIPKGMLEDSVIDFDEVNEICEVVLNQLGHHETLSHVYNIKPCPSLDQVRNLATNIPWINHSGIFGLYKAQKESIISEIDKLIEDCDKYKFEDLKNESYQTSTLSGVKTDPSQEEIVNSITKDLVRIVQGPPGTGKSQSLTAIITNALVNKAKTLVVCEKKTALEVIYNNLCMLGYNKLCAVIDDVTRDRKKIIETVRDVSDNAINSSYIGYDHVPSYRKSLETYESLVRRINGKHSSIFKKIFGDYSWKDVVGKFIAFNRIDIVEDITEKVENGLFEYDYNEYIQLSECISEGNFLFNKIENINHPLQDLHESLFRGPYLNAIKIRIEQELKALKKNTSELIDFVANRVFTFNEFYYSEKPISIFWITFLSIFSKRYSDLKLAKQQFISGFFSLIEQNKSEMKIPFAESFIEEPFDFVKANILCNDFVKKVESLIENMILFKDYFQWQSFYNSKSKKEKSLLLVLAKSKNLDWEGPMNRWFFHSLLLSKEEDSGPFMSNSRDIEALSDIIDELKSEQQKVIRYIWRFEQIKSITMFKEIRGKISSLYNYRRNSEYQRKNSLRFIIHTDFNLFTDFFPVILVNPVVASSIIPLKEGIFELVIFDEASQLRLEDTYSSFVRGKYKVISGDVHQMPPSNYFGRDILLEEDLEEDEPEENSALSVDDPVEMADKESLLQFAEDMEFKKSFLDYHYRSRHPYLIEFSNAAFYGSRLKPMPEKRKYRPIRFVEVNGIYEKNRTNPSEAEAVIDILLNRIKPNKEGQYPSVGIATFNIDQRNLILETIQDKCYLDKSLNIKLEHLRENGLFVKNLENIQGDERDIIIITTTFGMNSSGIFRQNFGPISRIKGYRLLNVIITRAKHQVFICTSIPNSYYLRYKEEIEANGNIGKAVFYAYLAYAKSIEDRDDVSRKGIIRLLENHCQENQTNRSENLIESPFEQEVYEYLIEFIGEERIDIQYEVGGFRIDFVIRSQADNEPIMALECDGKWYHSSEEAYSHDLYRQKTIEELIGLKFYRIFSSNWWPDPEGEILKLTKFLNEIDKNTEAETLGSVLESESFYVEEDLLVLESRIEEVSDSNETRIKIKPIPIETKQKDKKLHAAHNGETKRVDKGVATTKSVVTLKNMIDEKILSVKFTSMKNMVSLTDPVNLTLHTDSPLAKAVINHSVGERVKVNGLEVYYEIIKIN